ncbi:polysaccharide deacetylase family protein [Streptococcus dentasini]
MNKQSYSYWATLLFLVSLLGIMLYQHGAIKKDLGRTARSEKIFSKKQGSVVAAKQQDTWLYYPCNDKGKAYAGLKETMNKAAKTAKDGDYQFIGMACSDSALRGVQRAKLYEHPYYKRGASLRKGKSKTLKTFLLKSDHTVLKLTDLLSRTTNLRAALLPKIEAALKVQGISKKQKAKVLTVFKKEKLSQITFSYSQSQLVLSIGGQKVMIAVISLYDILNPNYLKDSDLQAYQSYKHGAGLQEKMSGHVVALTFDDGPNPVTTPKVLKTLKKYKAKATFFVVGQSIAGNESILKEELKAGHDIGNHSWNHPQLNKLPTNQASAQITQTSQAIEKATGQAPKLLRPPYGATNDKVRSLTNLYQVLWDVDTLDWKNRNTQAILSQVKSQVKDGSVILMHDIHPTTVNALPAVLEYLRSQGYKFVTVSELYGYA